MKIHPPLHQAAYRLDTPAAKRLLAEGAKINGRSDDGTTALHDAAAPARVDDPERQVQMINFLLDNGADINAEDGAGWTPLVRAALRPHVAAVKALLDRGAEVNPKCKQRWGALHTAADGYSAAHVQVVKLLLDKGADVNAKSIDGYTPRMLAQRGQNIARQDPRNAEGVRVAYQPGEREEILALLESFAKREKSHEESRKERRSLWRPWSR